MGSRPESLTLASIYERHVTEIRREQPDARRIDASRLDAEVAVRMAVTGHSREQIAKAILDGARANRPHEDRDWQAYAATRGPTRVQCSWRASPVTPRASPRQAPAARRSPGRTTARSEVLVVHRGDCDPAPILVEVRVFFLALLPLFDSLMVPRTRS